MLYIKFLVRDDMSSVRNIALCYKQKQPGCFCLVIIYTDIVSSSYGTADLIKVNCK